MIREQLLSVVRRRPRSLGLPFSLWTADRLADYLAEQAELLQALVDKHPTQKVFVAWDNSSTHEEDEVERCFVRQRVGSCCSICRRTAPG